MAEAARSTPGDQRDAPGGLVQRAEWRPSRRKCRPRLQRSSLPCSSFVFSFLRMSLFNKGLEGELRGRPILVRSLLRGRRSHWNEHPPANAIINVPPTNAPAPEAEQPNQQSPRVPQRHKRSEERRVGKECR